MSLQLGTFTSTDVLESARLTNKAFILINALGGLLPGLAHEYRPESVLEVACNSGGWLLNFAQTYKEAQVVGVDTRSFMINTTMQRVKAQQLENVSAFYIPTLTELPFEDESFDIISMQFISLLLSSSAWPRLLAECQRVLRPGGLIRITEFDLAQSNSPAHEEWSALCLKTLHKMGHSPSSSNRHLSWFYDLEPMASVAGFLDCIGVPHIVNYSYGVALHETWKRDLHLLLCKYLPQMIELDLLTEDQGFSLQKRVQQEMELPNFRAIQSFLSVYGRKPAPVFWQREENTLYTMLSVANAFSTYAN